MGVVIWAPLNDPGLAIFNDLSASIAAAERAGELVMPDLRGSGRVIVVTDYRKPDDGNDFHVISYLVMGAESIPSWDANRAQWRKDYMPDNRRLAFKDLGRDAVVERAVGPFLSMADSIDGVIVTLAIHKNIKSLFAARGLIDMTEPRFEKWRHWKPRPFENVLRILFFEGVLLAGLTADKQRVFCISDSDEVLARGLQEFCDISNDILPSIVPHELRMETATTLQDDGSLFAEDLAAIPDLTVGALGEVLTAQARAGVLPMGPIVTFLPAGIQDKSQSILGWLYETPSPLKRFLICVHRESERRPIRSAIMKFWDGIHALDT
jgi:hypothetical protein